MKSSPAFQGDRIRRPVVGYAIFAGYCIVVVITGLQGGFRGGALWGLPVLFLASVLVVALAGLDSTGFGKADYEPDSE